ncbi:MAG: dienelactone hydrolase family protein [Betaproteobacteria bacterium]|nr:dienelactone hydrolase family protein [Betaproteobacteria bacterium]
MKNELQRHRADEAAEYSTEGSPSRRKALRLFAGLTGAALGSRLVDAQTAPAAPAPAAPSAPPAAPPARPAGPRSAMSVKYNDPEILTANLQFPGSDAQLMGYIARPLKAGTFPIVLVCHESRGLTRHIEDVTRRLAKAGYVGFAVDLLSREGGTNQHGPDAVSALLGKPPIARHVQDFQGALAWAKSQPFAKGDRAGMVGFSFGAGVTWRVAAATPELKAAIPFYGLPVAAPDVPKINAAVLAIYAGRDERINANIPAIEAAMREKAKVFRKIVYPDVDHAFYNDTGDTFSAGSAQAAWEESLGWFARFLKDA